MAPPAANAEQIATLRIELLDSDPPIWREVEVPTAITLDRLHDIVQAAMGWFNQHLWEIRLGRQRYGLPMDDDWGETPMIAARKVRLSDILEPRWTTLEYTYDFGDNWDHRLTLSRVRPAEPCLAYPRYIAGERAAPPEDCGGIPGFYAALEALADPGRPEHQEVSEWFGDYDPEAFDEARIGAALGRIAGRRRTTGKRSARP